MVESDKKQIQSESDRETLRAYLTGRLKHLRKELKKAPDREDASFVEGAEMEIIFLFDDLLGEQAPVNFKGPKKAS